MAEMAKFVALPVGQGDAFYLERGSFHALVDGGNSSSAISTFVSEHTRAKYLDVVVCTHNDADHAEGIIGLLENWKGEVREVWLPRLEGLLGEPAEFCRELFEDVVTLGQDGSTSKDSKMGPDSEDTACDDCEELALDEYLEKLSYSDDEGSEMSWVLPDLFLSCLGTPWPLYHPGGKGTFGRLINALETANRIRKIAILSFNRGCRIRFFEFGSIVSGGIKGEFEPVNSREVVRIHPQKIGAYRYLFLTKANQTSLVFFAPERVDYPAVLFTADSDLNFSLPQPPPKSSPIISSPHHGSEENKDAYNVVSTWLTPGSITPKWIRIDCKSSTRPGISFRSQEYRICTLCNSRLHPKRVVKMHVRSGRWQLTKGTRRCSCR